MRPTPANLVRILVPIKRCVDYAVKIRVKPDGSGIDTNVKHSMNPFDEIAVEEAVRLRERNKEAITNITAITIGPAKASETLRTALAMGADSAIHVEIPESLTPEPLGIAKALRALIEREQQKEPIDLVIMGKQAIDDDAGQTGQMLAGLLDWAQATYASKVTISDDKRSVNVVREVDGGAEEVEWLRIDHLSHRFSSLEPRYASLPNIMKAKKKPIEKLSSEDLKIDLTPKLEVFKYEEPPKRVGGGKVANVDELVAKLAEAGIKAIPTS
ncbi:hypothetical protein Clacol_009979 [Clathrus columnatus]|uniref:Probable electron transfer flavoprotein subunit beta n=1 Tax=Clathrus columnatus TaxID=1419009 RepID=A0AAV5ASG3_9AGAM|nr:hypothetical protein Clacol_009979 [Clathrus columnatus]